MQRNLNHSTVLSVMRSCQYGSVTKNMWNPIRKTIRQRTSPEFRRFHKEKHRPVSCRFLRARRNPLRNQSVNTRVPNSRFKESIKYEWYIFFLSSRAAVIHILKSILQSGWFRKLAKFFYPARHGPTATAGWSIFVNELPGIVNLLPLSHTAIGR